MCPKVLTMPTEKFAKSWIKFAINSRGEKPLEKIKKSFKKDLTNTKSYDIINTEIKERGK